MPALIHVSWESSCDGMCEKARRTVHRQRLSCSHPFGQIQGGKSITQGRVVPSGQLLGAVASPSFGRFPDEPRVLAHRTLPPWQFTGQSLLRAEVPYCRVPYSSVVEGVEDYYPSTAEHVQKVGVNIRETRSARKALRAVAVDGCSTSLCAARGL